MTELTRRLLNTHEFVTMHDVRAKLKAWQHDFNHCQPHGSLGHLTPSEFATMRSGQRKEAARLWFKPVRFLAERHNKNYYIKQRAR